MNLTKEMIEEHKKDVSEAIEDASVTSVDYCYTTLKTGFMQVKRESYTYDEVMKMLNTFHAVTRVGITKNLSSNVLRKLNNE